MSQADLHTSLSRLFSELTEGAPGEAYVLNGGDPGLFQSLDRLSAEAASKPAAPGAGSIAAHVDHVCYGLDLLLRWSHGEQNPWGTADWAASWTRTTVDERAWAALRERLRTTARRWQDVLQQPRTLAPIEMNGVIASVVHLAYHIGAIRQIDRSAQGPRAR
jgi:hypothetical protein